ncbi:hypothetical protein [Chitiniphilus eburneus]|uniref:hypothetical protein n=1 Tax=Chitiniphilus eburneus TaxID=2571148 RepID=UPI0035D138D6
MVRIEDAGVVVSGTGPTTIQNLNMMQKASEIEWDLVRDPQRFYQMFKFYASTPARLALLRLFDEDILPRSVAGVWKDELLFEEPRFTVTVRRWVPWATFAMLMVASLAFAAAFTLPVFVRLTNNTLGFLIALNIVSWSTLIYLIWVYAIPYNTCTKLAKIVEVVNKDLPRLFEVWRESRWYRQQLPVKPPSPAAPPAPLMSSGLHRPAYASAPLQSTVDRRSAA